LKCHPDNHDAFVFKREEQSGGPTDRDCILCSQLSQRQSAYHVSLCGHFHPQRAAGACSTGLMMITGEATGRVWSCFGLCDAAVTAAVRPVIAQHRMPCQTTILSSPCTSRKCHFTTLHVKRLPASAGARPFHTAAAEPCGEAWGTVGNAERDGEEEEDICGPSRRSCVRAPRLSGATWRPLPDRVEVPSAAPSPPPSPARASA
jgi:hypothetical protein